MPRQRNPVGIAAGKLILALRAELDGPVALKVIDRAHILLQASRTSSVKNLLDGRSVAEYLDTAWVEAHPGVKADIDAFVAALNASEAG